MVNNRINSLDYLRGVMAIFVMLYHYFSWSIGPQNSEDTLGILGVYGVAIFYVLSGLTLYWVYHDSLTIRNIPEYFIKRFFRILPLMWLGIVLTIYILDRTYSVKTIMYNLTGVFGFFAHQKYIATGAWSIGNEIVFYAFVPIVLLLAKKFRFALEGFFFLALLIGIYFAFFKLDATVNMGKQWVNYINPLNHLFLFAGGMLIGKMFMGYKNNKIALALFVFALLFLFLSPVEGNKIAVFTHWNRLIYASFSFAIVIAFYLFEMDIPRFIDALFVKIGHFSYSLYLMHPLVYYLMEKNVTEDFQSSYLMIIVCVLITFPFSYLLYELYERQFVRLGNYLLKRIG